MKWFLLIPHLIVLGFFWSAFVVLTVVAFLTQLRGGRYPRGSSTSISAYCAGRGASTSTATGALGTDRYPAVHARGVSGLSRSLEIDYPEEQATGRELLSAWVAGIPQYVLAGILGGGVGVAWAAEHSIFTGLTGVLVFLAAVSLAVNGAYPRRLFDYVIDLNRWIIRVVAYGALMTTAYPPFLLDKGGREPTRATAPAISEAGA